MVLGDLGIVHNHRNIAWMGPPELIEASFPLGAGASPTLAWVGWQSVQRSLEKPPRMEQM